MKSKMERLLASIFDQFLIDFNGFWVPGWEAKWRPYGAEKGVQKHQFSKASRMRPMGGPAESVGLACVGSCASGFGGVLRGI